MEKNAKNLKFTSIAILIVTALRMITAITTLVFGGLKVAEAAIPAGLSQDLFYIMMVVAWAVSFVAMLPAIYLGLKGLKMAKNPDGSKAHIVWAMILFIFAVIAIVGNLGGSVNVLDLVEVGAIGVLYLLYYIEAKKLRVAA